MRILGIDPGSRTTGYAVIDVSGNDVSLSAMGVIQPGDKAFTERILDIVRGIEALIDEHHPEAAVVETAYWGKGAQSSLRVAEVRGAVIAAIAGRSVTVSELSPAKVKKAVTGRGQASKEQVEFMVKHMVGVEDDAHPQDAYDALAIAIAYSNRLTPLGNFTDERRG